jgi:putative transposase
MRRDAAFAVGETYHVYNRGAHKLEVFRGEADYGRFLLLLHLANHSAPIVVRDVLKKYRGESSVIFREVEADKVLVDILAYCLMPNHFHLVLRQKSENGISTFLRRLLTGYSMYFNLVHKHSGTLFQGPSRSKYIGAEAYFRYIFAYTHLNPLELVNLGWKEGKEIDTQKSRTFLNTYRYSSFYDYYVDRRPENIILAKKNLPDFLTGVNDFEELVRWRNTEESPL